jgi:glycosyltransferase involved in cell wall biosynthesis
VVRGLDLRFEAAKQESNPWIERESSHNIGDTALKVVFVTAAQNLGGAGRAAARLSDALRTAGIDIRGVCLQSSSSTELTEALTHSNLAYTLAKIADRLPVLRYRNGVSLFRMLNFSCATSRFSAVERINSMRPDLVHLHWINYGLLSPEDIAGIEAPVVWTLHDMWPVTGGCHYDRGCGRYVQGCGLCPVLGSTDKHDLSQRILARKVTAWGMRRIHVVTPSKWLGRCARESWALRGQPVNVIPNCIDLEVFRPVDRNDARRSLQLPERGRIILVGGVKGVRNPVKGTAHLPSIVRSLSTSGESDIHLAVMGSGKDDSGHYEHGLPTHMLGHISSLEKLRCAYNAADVFAIPSEQDNLPNTVVEALACGTPVVGFNIGGIPDIVQAGRSGETVMPFDTVAFSQALLRLLRQPARDAISKSARSLAIEMFTPATAAAAHIAIYQRACAEWVQS